MCFFVFLALKEGRHLTARSGPCSRILPVKLANHSVRISEVIIVRVISEKRGSLKALVNEDTLLPRMFLGLRKLGNIYCGHKMFLNKIRNIFLCPGHKICGRNKCCVRGQIKRGNSCVGNNVSTTMCPRLTQGRKKPTTARARATSLNKRFNEQINVCAVLCTKTT